jgi:hypothetical protein
MINVPILVVASDGVAHAGNTNNTPVTTTADCPAGTLLCAAIYPWQNSNTVATAAVSDSVGNVYQLAGAIPPQSGGFTASLYYARNCIHLPSGGTITANLTSAQNYTLVAWSTGGASGGLDTTSVNTHLTASVTTNSVTTPGALASSNSILFGILAQATDSVGLTEANGYTKIPTGFPNTDTVDIAWLIQSNSSAQPPAYNPSWTNAQLSGAMIVAMIGAGLTIAPQTTVIM